MRRRRMSRISTRKLTCLSKDPEPSRSRRSSCHCRHQARCLSGTGDEDCHAFVCCFSGTGDKVCHTVMPSPAAVCQPALTVQTFNSCTNRPDVCQSLVLQTPMDNMSKDKPSISVFHIAWKSKLRLVVRSSMHPCPGNWVAIGRVVVFFARLPMHLVQELNVGTVSHAFAVALKLSSCLGPLVYHRRWGITPVVISNSDIYCLYNCERIPIINALLGRMMWGC